MSADEFKAKGNSEFSAGNYQAAVEAFTKAIEIDSSNHVFYSNRSGAYAAMNNFEEALKDAELCVEKKPDWFKAYSRKAAAFHGLRNLDAAITQYEKALTMAEGNQAATIQANIEELKMQKEQQHAAQQQQAAANPFAKAFGPDCLAKIASNPKLQPLLARPGFVEKIKMIQQQPQLAGSMIQDQDIMTAFIELMGLGGQFASAAEGGAGGKTRTPQEDAAMEAELESKFTEEEKKKMAESQEEQRTAALRRQREKDDIERERKNEAEKKKKEEEKAAAAAKLNAPAEAAKAEGNKFYLARQFDEALEKYDEAFKLDSSNTTYLLNRTAVLFEQGKYETVIEECEKALEHAREHHADFPLLAKIMTRKASSLQKLQKHEEALKIFQSALLEHRNKETLAKFEACKAEKKQIDAEAYFSPELSVQAKDEGNVHFKANRYPEAVKCYDEAIKRNPEDHIPYSNRAGALIKLTAFDDAIKDCDKCLELKPDFIRAYARKGQAYFLTKQYHRALQMYEEGLKLDKEHQECQEGRMRVMMKIQEVSHSEGDSDVAQRAMMDPEIQGIMQDSYMQMVLQEVQKNPARLNEYMQDSRISANINKLIAAGIIRMGSGPASSAAAGRR